MADPTTSPEQTPPPTSTPAAPEAPKGIAAAMAQLDAGVAEMEKAKSDATPKEPAKETLVAAPEKTEDKTPSTEPKPEPEVEPQWEKAPKNLKNAYFKYRRETTEKITKAEARIRELESKATQTPADLAKIKQLEERAEQLQKELDARETALVEADYSKSTEFKRDYVDKANAAYTQAISVIKTLTVTNSEGESRLATEADFRALLKMEPAQQDIELDKFGVSKNRVLAHINKIQGIEEAGNEAIARAREKAAEKTKQHQAEIGTRSEVFKQSYAVAQDELVKFKPEVFGTDEANPEANKIFENGLKFYDDTVANNGNLTPQQLAERAVIMRYGFAAYPKLELLLKKERANSAALKEELAKYRKSAPGNANLGGDRTPPSTSGAPKSIMEAAKAFDGK